MPEPIMPEPSKERVAPRKKSRIIRILVLVVIVAGVAYAGVRVWNYLNTYEGTDDAQIDGHINAISGRITGNVIAVLAEDEQFVKQGDVLVRIDPRDYEVAVAKAEADLLDAEAALQSSRIDIPITSANTSSQLKTANSGRADATAFLVGSQRQLAAARDRLETAHAEVREAQANVKKTGDDVVRYKLLVDKNEIPRQQFDSAVAEAAEAQATLDARNSAVSEAEQNIAAAQSAVDQAQQRIPQADASIESASTAPQQVQVSECRAPVRAGASGAEESTARSGKAEPELLHHRRAGNRHCGQEDRGTGTEYYPRPAADGGGSARRHLGHRQFQGETQLSQMATGQRVRFNVDANDKEYNGKVVAVGGASGSRFSLLPLRKRDGKLRESGATYSCSH